MAAGVNHVVVLTSDGRVLAFGSGRHHKLAEMDIDMPGDVRVRMLTDEAPNTLGRTGRGRREEVAATMLTAEGVGVKVDSKDPVVDVYCGSYSGFAVTASRRVFAWGLNKNGQLGLGHTDDVPTPKAVPALAAHGVVAIAGGDFHTLALTASGDVLAYGAPPCEKDASRIRGWA